MPDDIKIEYARAALVINTNHIADNIRVIKKLTNPAAMVMAVVKADGYGHGAVKVSQAALEAGADRLGVATVEEGASLRASGLEAPILVMNPTSEGEFDRLIHNDLASTVFSLRTCENLSKTAGRLGKSTEVHVKIDTGMNRIGYNYRDINTIISEVRAIRALPNIKVGGMYSHFAASDSDPAFVNEQFSRFMDVVHKLEAAGVHIPVKHISNSGGVLYHPECNLDMVRCGILIYGLPPCSTPEGAAHLSNLGFKPALTLVGRVAHVKTVEKGESIGYSRNYFTQQDTEVVTVPIGYADGISRRLSNKGKVLINGHTCDIIGNVCMNQMMVDSTGSGAKFGDEVVFIGKSGNKHLSAEDVAALQGSINYEVATSLSLRFPTYYI